MPTPDNPLPLSLAGRPPGSWIAAPSPVYLTGEEFLRLTSIGNASGVTLLVSGFVLRPDNSKAPFTQLHTPNSNRTAGTADINLPEGWLLGLRIVATAGTPAFGQVWVELALGIGRGTSKSIIQSLGYGFCTTNQPFVWPRVDNQLATDGPGHLRSITGATPAAGADISETVPANARWRLLAIKATFQASAVAGNRKIGLVLDDGTNSYWEIEYPTAVTVSQSFRFTFADGYGAAIVGTNNEITICLLQNNRLGPGHRIRTNTNGLDAGDAWTLVQYLVVETFDV